MHLKNLGIDVLIPNQALKRGLEEDEKMSILVEKPDQVTRQIRTDGQNVANFNRVSNGTREHEYLKSPFLDAESYPDSIGIMIRASWIPQWRQTNLINQKNSANIGKIRKTG